MAHHHNHSHEHAQLTGRKLLITIVLNIIITVAQAIGGLLSGSLALLSDAVHNLSDVMALVIVYVANRVAQGEANAAHTFGYKRVELLAALFNAVVLGGIAVLLMWEGVSQLGHPEPIQSGWVIGLAGMSIVLNWVSVMLVAQDAESNSNVKAAYLHLMTDVMTSFAVLIGGLAMLFWQVYWIDAIISLVIALYLGVAAWGLVKSTSSMLLQFTPPSLAVENIATAIQQFDSIDNMHHLHLWQLDDHHVHLEAHLDFKEDVLLSEVTKTIEKIEIYLHEQFDINHCTLQAEYGRQDSKDLIHNNS